MSGNPNHVVSVPFTVSQITDIVLDAAQGMDHKHIENLIMELDDAVADYDFSLGLIQRLIKSLSKDSESKITAKDLGLN